MTVLITSLLDNQQYPHDVFADLYHLRWPVEEDYKVLKCRLEVGKTLPEISTFDLPGLSCQGVDENLAAVLTGRSMMNWPGRRLPASTTTSQFHPGTVEVQ